MEQKSMTAKICAFSRAYHNENNKVKIFEDSIASLLLTDDEYNQISFYMSKGIKYFNTSFIGNDEEALKYIVDKELSPNVLGRSSFTEKALEKAVNYGARQYLIFAAGYDTFAYRQPSWAKKIQIFEIDYPTTSKEKIEHLKNAGIVIQDNVTYIQGDFTEKMWEKSILENINFDMKKISFSSLLGLTYYLSKQKFIELISIISSMVPINSSIVFDYPTIMYYKDKNGKINKHSELAEEANEKMISAYEYEEIEKILEDNGFLIFEHITPHEITEQYFNSYNEVNPSNFIIAPNGVNYCLAVKKY